VLTTLKTFLMLTLEALCCPLAVLLPDADE
jgi:hypothetical protein